MRTYLEPEEVELLEKAATNLRDRLLIRLLFRLGCRISEALALRVEDIDFDQGTVTIQHLKARSNLFCPHCNARLRAARRLWARIMKEKYGAKRPASMRLRFYGPTVGADCYAKEPLNNIIRGAIAALASVLSGANAIDLAAYDEPFATPTETAKLLCIRTQQIIAYETGVADVVDPLGGSYYVESLTCQLEEEMKKAIQEIDKQGGFLAALEKGYIHRKVADYGYHAEMEKFSGQRPVIGVNMFVTEEEERPIEIMKVDPEAERRQIERTKRVKAERDNVRAQALLERIREAASDNENLMPLFLEGVKAHVNLGEIMQVLKDVFGEWEEMLVF